MAKLRWIGDGEVFVPVLGRNVRPDEVVDVADELIATHDEDGNVTNDGTEWPAANWSVHTEPKKAVAKADTKGGE